jgi:DUF2993 family protein
MRRIIVLAVVAAIVLAFVLAQLFLPGIAAQRLRDRLARSGTVERVEVDAFPAIELLWHHADKVVIRMSDYRSDPSTLGTTLGQAADAGSIDASATTLDTGLLRLHDAVMHKRGDELTGSARVTEADLKAAVPFLQSVQPVASGNGQLVLRGTASVLGVAATADATVAAVSGAVVVQPDVPFGGLATLTLFSSPHVRVDGVSATPAGDGFTVSARARVT